MRFHERQTFQYDPDLFKRNDVVTALKIYAEYIQKSSPQPTPKFFEVDRGVGQYDDLWHAPVGQKATFSRQIDMQVINIFEKPDWRLTKLGLVPQRRDKFLCATNLLIKYDYFPTRGDQVFWNGYRYQIVNTVIPPEAYWQQTSVWLGLLCECVIVPEGDARPVQDLSKLAPADKGTSAKFEHVKTTRLKPLPELGHG